jgi:cystathionine beta-lyase/cystathionine gamma-synthase
MQPKITNLEQLQTIVNTILAIEDLKDKSERVNDDARMHFTMKELSDSMLELTIWNVDYLQESPFENDTHEPKFSHMTFNIPIGTIKYGADLVIHSGTKYMDGQGRVIGGVIVGRKDLIQEIRFFARHTGPSLSPMNAWVLSKSLETLAIRMERHSHNALKLAEFLETQSDVAKVVYPFLPSHPQNELAKRQMKLGGGIVSFIVEGGIDRGRRFLNSLEMFSHTANLGDSRTIATHPASTTHSKLTDKERLAVGIAPGLIRISVGLEHISDIILEVKEALKKSN